MIGIRLLNLRFLAGLTAGALLAFLAAGVAVKRFRQVTPQPQPPPRVLLAEGFDFRKLRGDDNKWRGPALGEKIDLRLLVTRDGSRLSDRIEEQPAMLASLNPVCRMCKVSIDEMQYIREHVVGLGIHYYPVSFNAAQPSYDFPKYARSLGFETPAFEWASVSTPPSAAIVDMTVPSHLLVDRNGTVIRVWPGSYADSEVRQRMGSQIVEDTLLVTETLEALLQSNKNRGAARK